MAKATWQAVAFGLTALGSLAISLDSYAENDTDLSVQLYGTWQKEFIIDDGRRNHDPRWTFSIGFRSDGTFFLEDHSVGEKWLSDGSVQPIHREVRIAGTYEVEGGVLRAWLDRTVTEDEATRLTNIGYKQDSGEAVARFWFEDQLLVIEGTGASRKLYLRRGKDDKVVDAEFKVEDEKK